jgi:hypothetical protein
VAIIVGVQDEVEVARERSRRRRAEEARRLGRRRILLRVAALVAVLAFVVGALVASSGGAGDEPPSAAAGTTTPATVAELPGGGRRILPGRRVVAFYGTAGTPVLGTLGRGSPAAAAARLKRVARAYAGPGRPKVLPAFELIATVASSAAGADDLYRHRKPLSEIRRYHRAIRRAGGILIIDVQPGRSDFFTEVQRYAPLLKEPDVSLALDPEWKMQPGEIPGRQIGSTDAYSVNAVSAWLSQLVRRNHLPQKLLIVHQFTAGMITNRARLKRRSNLAIAIHVDGFGDQPNKRAKYRELAPRRAFFPGFKLFYKEDVRRLTPRQVLGLRPAPLLVTYQ